MFENCLHVGARGRQAAAAGVLPSVDSGSREAPRLAGLLREVESWLEEESVPSVRFLLDDRLYTLRARGSRAA
jgi:hypothetical protein